jgi:aspartyl-tRNA(Asn)/glutamyl-tRNA(Gln) amidotransferase subunit B
MKWQTVIGLEVHAQLNTESKLFSSSASRYGAEPNTHVSYLDAGLPGVLPVLNQKAVRMAIQLGLAINATINNLCYFERKNYFYPDLPKGYQISQFQRPIVSEGTLEIEDSEKKTKKVIIHRAHLEEDAGKSIHSQGGEFTCIDLNRAGTPLLEIVTTPCLYSSEEVIKYLKALHQLLRFLGICDGNMQEGAFRCDVNLSLKLKGDEKLGTRTEIKNINSFRFVEKAIQYEEWRHQQLLESGQTIIQETRSYNADKNITEVLRSKENENDYRYFPDPDLLPIAILAEDIAHLKETLPPLPWDLARKFHTDDGLTEDQIDFLLTSPSLVKFYLQVKQETIAAPKLIVNWFKGSYAAAINERGLSYDTPVISPKALGTLLNHLHNKTLSTLTVKKVFHELLEGASNVADIIAALGVSHHQSQEELETIVRQIIEQFPAQTKEFQAGKDKLLSFFVGQVMKVTKGQADPAMVNTLLLKHLISKVKEIDPFHNNRH